MVSLIANEWVTKNAFLETNSAFIGLKPLFFLQELGFLKNARFCARFGGFTDCAKIVLALVSQLKQSKKTSETTILYLVFFLLLQWLLLLLLMMIMMMLLLLL